MSAPPYAELACASNFSFLHGASHASDLVGRALELGHKGLGIADRNTVAGVVRAWQALKLKREETLATTGETLHDFKLVTGARLVFADGTPDILAYPETRHGWGRLCRLLSTGNLRADKGDCVLGLEDLLAFHEDLLLIVLSESTRREGEGVARKTEDQTILPPDEGEDSLFSSVIPFTPSSVIPACAGRTRNRKTTSGRETMSSLSPAAPRPRHRKAKQPSPAPSPPCARPHPAASGSAPRCAVKDLTGGGWPGWRRLPARRKCP